MYEQQVQEDILFFMFYAAVAMLSLIACCYLLLRRGNAFAPDISTPAYTWYDKDAKCWEIGFFNDKALDVVFIKKDGKVSYEILKEVPFNNDHFLDK